MISKRVVNINRNCLKYDVVRPVRFGALQGAAERLFTKPQSGSKIDLNFEALSWFFRKEKPENSYEPGGLVNSLASGTLKI